MRTRSAFSGLIHRLNGRTLALALVVAALGFFPRSASALECTIFDVYGEGIETWLMVGEVDVNQEESEIAEIAFGGAASASGSSHTDHFGHFEHYFAAPYGSWISFTAIAPSGTSETYDVQMFSPDGEP